MRRREFLGLVGGLAAWPATPAQAQQSGKFYRMGYLSSGTAESRARLVAKFREGMRALGYSEGNNLSLTTRFAEGHFDRLPKLARELLDLKPDVMMVSTTPANLAFKAMRTGMPTVMVAVADPVGVGLVASLSHPGGNITGVTNVAAELAGKRLEILGEIIPSLSHVAVLINPDDPIASLQMEVAQAAAVSLAVRLDPVVAIRGAADLKPAFEAVKRTHAKAILRMVDPIATSLIRPTTTLELANRLPVMHHIRAAVELGGLASYGASLPDQYRQAATFVHKIFQGTMPADIPIERPTQFEMAVNRRTATALGLTLPTSILLRADQVIE